MIEIVIEPHPTLQIRAFETSFPSPLGSLTSPRDLTDLLQIGASSPFSPDEALRADVRDMLRHGGYKPTGRGKPASEYLVRAASVAALGSINPAVDACNAASLHGGFPISVVDLDRARPPFRVAIARPGERYIFNRSAQEIDVSGLVCLYDADGPCANAVKDAQRTKTDEATTRTLSIVWGTSGWHARLDAVTTWYRAFLDAAGARTVTAI
jgi:DNA/RNA-binding domain of Phe-tRNA-synthetase-like protein